MKTHKQNIGYALILLFFFIGNVSADTCYDPNYGNYECDPGYSSYPDQGAALMAGAFFGMMVGGALSDGGYQGGGGNNWNHGGGGHGGNYHGGNVGHGGGNVNHGGGGNHGGHR